MRKRKPHSALYWKLRRFFFALDARFHCFRAQHLSLGKQKWRDGKLYIEKIPPYIASEATIYLTAIIRDYLRAYTKNSYSIGNAYYLEKYHKNMWELTEEEEAEESGNEEFEHWMQMINGVADKFDETAALWEEGWETHDFERKVFDRHQEKIEEAFSALARIFQDLND